MDYNSRKMFKNILKVTSFSVLTVLATMSQDAFALHQGDDASQGRPGRQQQSQIDPATGLPRRVVEAHAPTVSRMQQDQTGAFRAVVAESLRTAQQDGARREAARRARQQEDDDQVRRALDESAAAHQAREEAELAAALAQSMQQPASRGSASQRSREEEDAKFRRVLAESQREREEAEVAAALAQIAMQDTASRGSASQYSQYGSSSRGGATGGSLVVRSGGREVSPSWLDVRHPRAASSGSHSASQAAPGSSISREHVPTAYAASGAHGYASDARGEASGSSMSPQRRPYFGTASLLSGRETTSSVAVEDEETSFLRGNLTADEFEIWEAIEDEAEKSEFLTVSSSLTDETLTMWREISGRNYGF